MPRNVTITFQNGTTHTYRNVPDNVTPDQIEQRAAKDFPRLRATNISGGKKAATPKPQPAKEPPGRLRSFGEGLLRGFENVVSLPGELLTSGLALVGDERAKKIVAGRPEEARKTESRVAPYKQARPNYFTAGQIVGETAASAPLVSAGGGLLAAGGGRLATVAPRAGRVVQRVGKAAQTGGIGAGRTAQATAKLSRGARVGQLAERVAGGALAGAGGAALTRQDVGEGAAFGAGLPIVASVLKRIGGGVADITKMPRQKAADIIRKSLGDKIDEARAAFAELSPDDRRLAEQVLVKAGVEPDTFFGIGAIAERELQPPGVNPMRETLEQQAATRAGRLAQVGGGADETTRRAAAELARSGVSEATGPMREGALERANVAGQLVPQAEALAAAARARADELTASGFVPRMRGLEQRAGEQAELMSRLPELFPESGILPRTREIAESAGDRATQAINAQIGLRDIGRDMEDVVAEMAAEGMQPLRVAPIVNQLRSMAAAPATRADKLQRTTLVRLATDLEKLADINGVIDARDLYQIRKTGVNDIVDKLLAGRQPTSGTKERTAGLLTGVRQMIDDAIEGSGGADWKDYLTRTRQGFEAVNRQELAATGAKLAEERPDEFVALMRGDRPKIVEDIMGSGTKQYDIHGMALADPQRYLALRQSADELETLNRMAELRQAGGGSAANLMIKERPSLLARGAAAATLSPFPAVRIGVQGAEQVERAVMAPRVQRQIAEAYRSGQAMSDLINTFPAKARMSEQISRLPPMTRNAFAQLLRQYMTSSPANYQE